MIIPDYFELFLWKLFHSLFWEENEIELSLIIVKRD